MTICKVSSDAGLNNDESVKKHIITMSKQNYLLKIIDWTDRKEVMATYKIYGELSMTGPNFQYYNGQLLPVDEPGILVPDPVPYQIGSEGDENQK